MEASIVQQASDEADAVEAELGPDEELPPDREDGTDAPEPEPEVETVQSDQATLEARDKKLTSEAKRHATTLGNIHGAGWDDYVMCPLCIGDGYLVPIPPGSQPDEIWEAVRALSGRQDTNALKLSKYAVLCEDCDGAGQVTTGARTDHGAVIICELCKSKGWYDPSDPQSFYRRPTNAPPSPPQLAAVPTQPLNQPIDGQQYNPPEGWVAGNNVGGNDQWGRWQGHPRYGIDTQYTGGTW